MDPVKVCRISPTAKPPRLLREYPSCRLYQADAVRLRRFGWAIVSALDRAAPSAPAFWVTSRVFGARPDREYLVTYEWTGNGSSAAAQPKTPPQLPVPPPGRHLRRWAWPLATTSLILLLADGLLGFLRS